MTFTSAPRPIGPTTSGQPTRTPRQKDADSYRAVLAAVLTRGLEQALEAGDHPGAVAVINRGFAEGSPQLGCELLCRASAAVGGARTWTVQMAPLSPVRRRSAAFSDPGSSD